MDKLTKVVGKRISEVYLRERIEGSGMQVFLFFSDGSYCQLTSTDSEIDIIVSEIDDPRLASELRQEGFNTVEQAIFDEDRAYEKRVQILFHRLWSRAGDGSNYYNKKEWMQLAQILVEAGINV